MPARPPWHGRVFPEVRLFGRRNAVGEERRFIGEDPAQDGANWYIYCYNNPLAFIDPSGLDPITSPNYKKWPSGNAGTVSAEKPPLGYGLCKALAAFINFGGTGKLVTALTGKRLAADPIQGLSLQPEFPGVVQDAKAFVVLSLLIATADAAIAASANSASTAAASLKANVTDDVAGAAGKVVGSLGPERPGQFVITGDGPLHATVPIREGTFVNRVFDTNYATNPAAAQPLGRYFVQGDTLPSTSTEAIIERGLNYPGVINDAGMGAVYRANATMPALQGPALGGTGMETIIQPTYWKDLGLVGEYTVIK